MLLAVQLKFNFVGDILYKTDKWNGLGKEFEKIGGRIFYFPYTQSTSSTLVNQTLKKLRMGNA